MTAFTKAIEKKNGTKLSRFVVSAFTAAALTLGMFTGAGCTVAGDGSDGGNAASETSTIADEQNALAAGSQSILTITAGAPHQAADSGTVVTYKYPQLTVSSNTTRKIKSITVQFTTSIDAGDDITLDAVSGKFELYAGNKRGNRSVNAVGNEGFTAAEWQSYLRDHLSVTLTKNENDVKGLRMIANFDKVTRTLDYNSENGHYYEMINSGAIYWHKARYEASKKSYLGMQGYLATITSEAENKLIGALVAANAWIGATCNIDFVTTLPNTPDSNFSAAGALNAGVSRAISVDTTLDSRAGKISDQFGSDGKSRWYWVTGPEAYEHNADGALKKDANGKLIYHPTFFCINTPMASTENTANSRFINTVLKDPSDTTKGYMFCNWAYGEPNGVKGGENVAHLYASHEKYPNTTNKPWNDYSPNNSGATSYLVEYGGLETDEELEEAQEGGSADVSFVRLDINLDTSGRTLSTMADDVTVGDNTTVKLPIVDSINGDTAVKTKLADNTTEDAVITHTFQKKNADGNWVDVPADELNENDEPFHAGEYKVKSTATHSVNAAGEKTPFNSGESTFKIKPKNLDLTSLAKPAITKVYDGTTDVPASALDIAGALLEGAKVTLTATAADARFDAPGVNATKVILKDAELTGADAGDYRLAESEDETVSVKAAITPRDLVVTTYSNVSWGLADVALKAADDSDPAYTNNLAIHTTGEWAANEIAQRDAKSLQETVLGAVEYKPAAAGVALDAQKPAPGLYTVETVFANVNAGAAKSTQQIQSTDTGDGDGGNDPAGMGTQSLGLMADESGAADTPSGSVTTTTNPSAAAGTPAVPTTLDAITARLLDDGRFDIGNYILTINNPQILITEDPFKETQFDDAAIFMEGAINEKLVIDKEPLDDDAVMDMIKRIAGQQLPEGKPTIVVTKDGVPVEDIDPSAIGSYAIVATWPNEQGKDTVVRVDYNIMANDPVTVDQEVTVKRTDGVDPVTRTDLAALVAGMDINWLPPDVTPSVAITKGTDQLQEIDLAQAGVYSVVLTYVDAKGAVRQVNLTYTVKEDAEHHVDEDINVPVDPDGTPLAPEDIAKRIQEGYPGLIPGDVTPKVEITKDGQPVDSVDPKVPGQYEVSLVYEDEEGNTRTVRVRYNITDDLKVYDPDEPVGGPDDDGNAGDSGNPDGTDQPSGDGDTGDGGMDSQRQGADPTVGDGGTGSDVGNAGGTVGSSDFNTQTGAKGFLDRTLAATGDPMLWAVCGLVGALTCAGAALAISVRRRKRGE